MDVGSEAFTFVVLCRAAPQGSKILAKGKGGKPFMRESSNGVHPFRVAVRRAAQGADGRPRQSFTGPVSVSIEFEFVQPKSNTDPYPTTKNTVGDIDKLTRAVLDGITEAEVIEDDRFVVDLEHVTKRWGHEDRAVITVTPVPVGPETSTMGVVDFSKYPTDRMRNPFDF